MSVATTIPKTITVCSTDAFWEAFTQAPQLPAGGSVSSPVVTLTDKQNNQTVALDEDPIVTGTKVLVYLDGSDLTVGHLYWLRIVFDGGTNAPALTSRTTVVCPN